MPRLYLAAGMKMEPRTKSCQLESKLPQSLSQLKIAAVTLKICSNSNSSSSKSLERLITT